MASRFVIMEQDREMTGNTPRVIIVRDGWSFFAFLFPLFWALWNRLWLVALMIFTAMLMLGFIASDPKMVVPAYIAMILVSAWIALENGQWRIAAFVRNGYTVTGALVADSLEDAELLWAERAGSRDTFSADEPVVSNHLIEHPVARKRTSTDMIFQTPARKR